jgi:geranylgeranylglycerol-phosphate geranylgeranyltransferase
MIELDSPDYIHTPAPEQEEARHASASRARRLLDLFLLTRPLNLILFALVVVVGGMMASGPITEWGMLAWAALAVSLVGAGGNVLNDLTDVPVDRVNRPQRPLAKGTISPQLAKTWVILLLGGSVASAIPLAPICQVIMILAVATVLLYDLWGKEQPLFGNLMVALLIGMAFPFGSLAAAASWGGVIPGVLAFLMILAWEIIKDLEDIVGDRVGGRNTWPLSAGESVARRSAQLALLALFVAIALPVLSGRLGIAYLSLAFVGVGVPVLIIIVRLSRSGSASTYAKMALILKWCTIPGLLALMAG